MPLQFYVIARADSIGQVVYAIASGAVVPSWHICLGLLCQSCSCRAAMHADIIHTVCTCGTCALQSRLSASGCTLTPHVGVTVHHSASLLPLLKAGCA